MTAGFGDKDKLKDALELAASFRKGGKGKDGPPPRMKSNTLYQKEPLPPPRHVISQSSGTPSVQNRYYSHAGSFSTEPQKTVSRKNTVFGSSGKDFLLRKDVPKAQVTASKLEPKEKQAPNLGGSSAQSPPGHLSKTKRPDRESEENRKIESQPCQPPASSKLTNFELGTPPKDNLDVKPENPGLASFLSFAPPGVFQNTKSATGSRSNGAENVIPNSSPGIESPAPTNTKSAASSCPNDAEKTASSGSTGTIPSPTDVKPATSSRPKEIGKMAPLVSGGTHMSTLINAEPQTGSTPPEMEKTLPNDSASTHIPPSNPKQHSIASRLATEVGERATRIREKLDALKAANQGMKQSGQSSVAHESPAMVKAAEKIKTPPPEVLIAPKAQDDKPNLTHQAREPLEGATKMAVKAVPVLKAQQESVTALTPLSNGHVKEQPSPAKVSGSPSLRPQAEDFSPKGDVAPVLEHVPQPIVRTLPPSLMNSIQTTIPGAESFQQFIPTGIATGQLVTTTEVRISGGVMTPGECRGTLYMQTPVAIHPGPPHSQGSSPSIVKEQSSQDRPSDRGTQRKPAQGLSSSFWAK